MNSSATTSSRSAGSFVDGLKYHKERWKSVVWDRVEKTRGVREMGIHEKRKQPPE